MASILRSVLSHDQLISWGWRIPFLAGIVVSLSGFYLKSTTSPSSHDPLDNNCNLNHDVRHHRDHRNVVNGSDKVVQQVDCDDDINCVGECDDRDNSNNDNNNSCIGSQTVISDQRCCYYRTPQQQDNSDDSDSMDKSTTRRNDDGFGIRTQPHRRMGRRNNHNPLLMACSSMHTVRSLIAATMVAMLAAGAYYLCFVWMAIYMTQILHEHPVPNGFAVNTAALLFSACILYPISGILSDIYGRKLIMCIGGIGLALFSPVIISFIRYAGIIRNPMIAFFGQWIMGTLVSLYNAPMCAYLVESFDPSVRLTSVAIGYNVANMIAGGLTPYFATILVTKYGPESPGWILTVLAIISVTGLLCVGPSSPPTTPETTRIPAQKRCSNQVESSADMSMNPANPRYGSTHGEVI